MTEIPRDHTGRPIRPTDLADLNDPTPPLSPTATPTQVQQAAIDGVDPPAPPAPPKKPAGPLGGILAWIVILATVSYLFASNNHLLDDFLTQQPVDAAAVVPFPSPDPLLEMQGRYLLGSKELLSVVSKTIDNSDIPIGTLGGATDPADSDTPPSAAPDNTIADQLADSLESFGNDDPIATLRVAMIAAELADADTAITYLDTAEQLLDDAEEPSAHDQLIREDIAYLRANYANPSYDSFTDDERESFTTRHGWLAKLALTFGDDDSSSPRAQLLAQTKKTSFVVIGAGFTIVIAVVVGFVLAILAIIFLATGTIKPLYVRSIFPAGPFAEAFALFLVAFLVIQELAAYIHQSTGNDVSLFLIWLLPLVALWPLLRGVPKKDWKLALGWHTGKGVIREIFAGIVGYLAGLPIVAIGIGSTFLLMSFADVISDKLHISDDQPTHPITQNIDTSNILAMLGIYITACVWAPFVEETLFRGALYNNTRRALHPLFAALFTGFIFASIHPQGWIAIPALMSLGTVFALIREWRGSIIAPAVAHAINNGFVFTLLILALS